MDSPSPQPSPASGTAVRGKYFCNVDESANARLQSALAGTCTFSGVGARQRRCGRMEMPCQAPNSQPLRVPEGMSAIGKFSPDSRALGGRRRSEGPDAGLREPTSHSNGNRIIGFTQRWRGGGSRSNRAGRGNAPSISWAREFRLKRAVKGARHKASKDGRLSTPCGARRLRRSRPLTARFNRKRFYPRDRRRIAAAGEGGAGKLRLEHAECVIQARVSIRDQATSMV
jgi:hypothetical protein